MREKRFSHVKWHIYCNGSPCAESLIRLSAYVKGNVKESQRDSEDESLKGISFLDQRCMNERFAYTTCIDHCYPQIPAKIS